MQIAPLGSSETVRDRALDRAAVAGPVVASARPAPVVAVRAPGRAGAAQSRPAPGLPKAGLSVWNPPLNQRLASAQQALQYLDRLSTRLQSLKSDLGSALGGAPGVSDRLESQRQALAQLWKARASQAGGQLDSRLVYSEDTAAVQGFGVRGLDATALQSGERETLAIALGTPTPARPAVLVVLEPGMDDKALARRFDQTLVPLGVRAGITEQHGLRFTVPESQWPAVRDTLSIRGEGRRFPTGPFHRVRTEAEPAAMAPEDWSLQVGPAGRGALQQIVEAQGRVGRAREVARGVVQQAGRELGAAGAARDTDWARQYTESFEAAARTATVPGDAGAATATHAPYHAVFAIGAALPGISRQRILSLLS